MRRSISPERRLTQLPLLVSASACGARASRRVGRSIGGRRKNRTRVRNSRRPARPRRQILEEERIPPAVAVAVAVAERNCNWARERGKAQSYLCRRSSGEQIQTRMRTPPMP